MSYQTRIRKLETNVQTHTPAQNRQQWQHLAALPREELLRLHAEHVDNKPLTAEQEAERERIRTLPVEELLRMHQANCR